MRAKYVGNKADKILFNINNQEATASIPAGTPVILKLSSTANTAGTTGDGVGVVLPSTAGDPNNYFGKFGVATTTVAQGQGGETVVFGIANALVTIMTRAATSNSWTSSASVASGCNLGIDSLNNAFLVGASSAGSLQGGMPFAVLLDTIASSAASATATSLTLTAIVNTYRVFVRMM